jgi:hypothetical protein
MYRHVTDISTRDRYFYTLNGARMANRSRLLVSGGAGFIGQVTIGQVKIGRVTICQLTMGQVTRA